MKAEVKNVKQNGKKGYQIEVETASIFDKAFSPETETKFIFPFFRTLAKHLRLDSGFKIYPVEAPTTSFLPTYAVAEHNHKLVVSPTLMERFDYDITILKDGGVSDVKNSQRLNIGLIEDGSIVSFVRGNKVLFTIPMRDIVEVAATSHVMGKIKKGNDFVIEVVFHDHERNKRSIILNVEDQYVNRIQQQISAIKDSELGIHDVIWGELDKLCAICIKNKPDFKFRKENICAHCFEEKYGKILLKEETGEYHGGHKVHLAGGTFGAFESGKMYLTDEYLIFAKGNKNPFKRWEIEIPINSIVLEQWGVRAESRRKHIVGGSTAVTSNVAFGGGVIQEAGKKHRLLVPYIDENGILQEPVFGISSFGGKAIRKWAAELYELMVKRKQAMEVNLGARNNQHTNKFDIKPIDILKVRLAKGEITKKEYEELLKMVS